jgi:hypothetical protein
MVYSAGFFRLLIRRFRKMALRTLSISTVIILLGALPAAAQSLGTFRWQLQPFGSVLNLTVTQQGSIYLLDGFEAQCGGNASLPVSGVAVPQANGQIFFGLTSITEQGRGLHTQARINTSTFSDNANQNGTFLFNPGNTCPGGPRISPIVPDGGPGSGDDASAAAALIERLLEQVANLQKRLEAVEGKRR